MNINFTFFSIIEDKYFYGFEKKIKSITSSLTKLGFKSKYVNINDLSINGIIHLRRLLKNSNSSHFIVRTIGIKSFILLFFLLFTKKNIILEIPTSFSTVNYEFLRNQKKNIRNYIYFFLNILITPVLICFFKKSIYYHEEKFPFNILNKKKTIIWSNGVDVKSIFPKKKLTKIVNYKINFICVGSLTNWHGVDRLIIAINNFQKVNDLYKFNINLVGDIHDSLFINNFIIEEYKEKGNDITFHGLKKDKNLFEVVNNSHIGVGSLGLKILNNYNRSELKIREYTAFGIPFIMEADDKEFNSNNNFLFKVNKFDYLIDINQVINWYINLEPEISIKMRKFAFDKLDYKIKVKELLNEIL